MANHPANHVRLAACPGSRHVAHPGYTCDEEDAIRARVAAHCGPQTTIPARALAGTTFGPASTRSEV